MGIPLIIRVIRRLQTFSLPNDLVLLCPQNELALYQDFLKQYECSIPIIGGDKDNVLSRYYHGVKEYGNSLIMRVTGDNPLISIPLAESLVKFHKKYEPDLSHYLKNPLGTGVELINFAALEQSYYEANTDFQKEHVTQYIYQNPQLFHIEEPLSPIITENITSLSVDYKEDISIIENLLKTDPNWELSNFKINP